MITPLRLVAVLMLTTASLASITLFRSSNLPGMQFAKQALASTELHESPREAQAAIRRVWAKAEVIQQLVQGELTLFDAAARFRHLNAEPKDSPSHSWQILPGADENEKVCRQVLYWVEGQFADRASENEVRAFVAQLEWELHENIQNNGSVRLPTLEGDQ